MKLSTHDENKNIEFIDPDEVVSDEEFESMKAELEKYLEVLKRKLKEKK